MIYCTKITAGGAATWPRGWWAPPPLGRAPLPRGPTVALLHLSQHPFSSSVSHKPEKPTQARVPTTFAVIFDLLAQAPLAKLLGEIVPWYVTPPLVQLVFILVLYSLQILAALVTLFLSFHVKFMRFQVILMHDIGSRHLWE